MGNERQAHLSSLRPSTEPVSETALSQTIRSATRQLHAPSGIDPASLLAAIAECESSYGANRVPRFEPAYAPGGRYYKRSDRVRRECARFGALASCSYGSFQILYITALEVMPVPFEPLDLQSDAFAIGAVTALLNRRFFDAQKITTVEDFADAYNSGNAKDAVKPTAYINKFVKHYRAARTRRPELFAGGSV